MIMLYGGLWIISSRADKVTGSVYKLSRSKEKDEEEGIFDKSSILIPKHLFVCSNSIPQMNSCL